MRTSYSKMRKEISNNSDLRYLVFSWYDGPASDLYGRGSGPFLARLYYRALRELKSIGSDGVSLRILRDFQARTRSLEICSLCGNSGVQS
jgi:hypothetical protein